MYDSPKPRSAFSLMELLAVVTILGIIAALIVPRVTAGTDVAKIKTCDHNHTEINITVEQYFLNTGAWPANDLSDIGANTNYFPDGLPTCPVTGAPYRLDPTTHRVIGHAGDSDH
jgi:general secretion pathway protein G